MINAIAYENLRRGSGRLEFGPRINIIRGKNEAGKSTVKEHINFSFWGTDSSGIKNPDHLITAGADFVMTELDTPGINLKRRKRRGATSEIKIDMKNNAPALKLPQKDLEAMIGMRQDTFTSCWQVGYFMSLSADKKIAVLGELASINRHELLKSHLPPDFPIPQQMKLQNCKTDGDTLASMRRAAQNQVSNHEGQLQQINSQLEALNAGTDVDVESYQEQLNEVNANIQAIRDYEKAVGLFNTAMNTFNLKTQAQANSQEDLNRVTARINELREKYNALQDKQPALLQKQEEALAEIKNTELQLKEKPVAPQNPNLPGEAVCSHCHQPVTEEYKQKLISEYNAKLMAYNEEARAVEDHNKNVSALIEKFRKVHTDLATEFGSAQTEMKSIYEEVEGTSKTEGLKARLVKIEASMKEKLVKPTAPMQPPGDLKELEPLKTELEGGIRVTQERYNQMAGLQQEVQNYQANIEAKKREVTNLDILEKLVRRIPEIETELTLKTISIPGCTASLVDGEFTLVSDMHGGIPYMTLSDGRKMKTDIAICVSLRNAALEKGKRAPGWMFVDNADLMDEYMSLIPQEVQVFVAKVDPSLEEVIVDQM